MNKISNINLGGYPFSIDEDAYLHLSAYLDTIHRHFKSAKGYEEITNDIESRLAEIFQERLGTRSIITLKDTQTAIEIMGKPEDFGAEPIENQQSTSSNQSTYTVGKRLFRDPEDKVVGGVCAGIAAYFGVQDPLWVRLAFVFTTMTFGVGVMLYFVLLVILPKAESSADRLAMRGEPINVSNIAKIIEEEAKHFSENIQNTFSEISNDFTNADSKKKVFGARKGQRAIGFDAPLPKGFLF